MTLNMFSVGVTNEDRRNETSKSAIEVWEKVQEVSVGSEKLTEESVSHKIAEPRTNEGRGR